jgi:hypothetical protein
MTQRGRAWLSAATLPKMFEGQAELQKIWNPNKIFESGKIFQERPKSNYMLKILYRWHSFFAFFECNYKSSDFVFVTELTVKMWVG